MKELISLCKTASLFRQIPEADLAALLTCIGARAVPYARDACLLMAGDRPCFIGVLLTGTAQIVRESADGSRTIIAALSAGDYFAEALCCAGVDESPVSVFATADSLVLQLAFEKMVCPCTKACGFHAQLTKNMLSILAQKNIFLQSRMEALSQKTLRRKILTYLTSMAGQQGDNFAIPLNREELADYLCADRSSLSHELMRMKKDGLIDYKKNQFTLLQ